jgi:hypothetical protein
MNRKFFGSLLFSYWVYCLCASGAFFISTAQAAGLSMVHSADNKEITGLSFEDDHPGLDIEDIGDRARYYAIIEGTYARKNWTLIVGRVKVPRDENGHFKLKTEFKERQKNLMLAAIGPDGEIEFESVTVTYPSYPLDKSPRRNSFSLGLGVTHMWYSQEGSTFSPATSFTEDTLTLKGSYLYKLAPPHWDIGLSAFVSTLTFDPSIGGTTARSLGINARIGYNIALGHSPWTLSIMGGYYYTTMFVSPSNFGFENMTGPQLFPVIRRTLRNQDSILFYAKYSPVSAGSISLQPSSREIAGGFTYSHLLSNGHSIPFSLDISNLSASATINNSTGSLSQSVNVELTTASLSAGYTF